MIKFSDLAVNSFNSSIDRVIDNQTRLSIIDFIIAEKHRRSIIGYFTNRSLENLSELLNESPNIRDFFLNYSEMFFFKLQEEYYSSVDIDKFNSGELIDDKDNVFKTLMSFLKKSLAPNRIDPDKDPLFSAVLGTHIGITYYQSTDEIEKIVVGSAWLIPYYILFVNFDKIAIVNDAIKKMNEQ